MGNVQTIKPETGLIRVPLNYPTVPSPGKLQLLLETNEKSVYHRYSPYVDSTSGVLDKIIGSKQPFIYDYIDESKKGLSGLRKFEGRIFPIGSAPRDIIRVSKFLGSGNGILFLGKQFLLQTSNAFNETRLYNPTSPIVAAGTGLTFGLVRPQRNIDLTGGLGGLARSVIGNAIPNLFGSPTVSPPPGTLAGALPSRNQSDGKGLLRAQTANTAKTILEARWAGTGTKSRGIGSFFKGLAKSLFGNFIPHRQSNAKFRSDEGAYGLMIGNNNWFGYYGNSQAFPTTQIWIAGGEGIRKNSEKNVSSARIHINPDGKTSTVINAKERIAGDPSYIMGIGNVGIDINESKNELHPGIRYGDNVGVDVNGDYEASTVLLDYSRYIQPGNKFSTKKTDKQSIEKINESLSKVINKLKKSEVYDVSSNADSKVMPDGTNTDPNTNGYNKLFDVTNSIGISPMQYNGVLAEYRDKNIRMVDNSITNDAINKSLKFPGAGNFDAINTLRVLPHNKLILNSKLKNWQKWEPYTDDQIAFFFHDIVNDKYIPFRASVKGITEASQASWDELTFIGRADRLFSYGGFSRTLTFSFDILIGSILELSPTWNRINYLMSLVKPAGYTKSKDTLGGLPSLHYNKFIIPPMVMLTIGDMYKEQPIMITTLNINVPDDAIWETVNEENSKEWAYLVEYIKSSKVERRYGQFPRNVTISVTCMLLEKERAMVGAANFGHAPHTDDYHPMDISKYPDMHRSLVEYQFDHAVTPSYTDRKFTSDEIRDMQRSSI